MSLRISVITVTLNSGRFLAECLSSVAAQGNSLHEHIIVDGGSTDSTLEIVKQHAAADPRVRWISEPDRGISDAMNKGVALATGDVITHLNSDDYYPHPQVLASVQDCFTLNPSSSWLTGGFTFVSGEGAFLRDIRVRKYSFRRLVRGNILLHPSTFIKRDLFVAVGGFDVSLLFCMDYDLFLKLGSVEPPLVVDKQLSCFRAHPASRSVSQSEQAYAEEFRVRMDYLHSKGRSTIYYYLDYQLKRRLNKLLYRGLLSANKN
ncbi:MAG: glycosyltransferase [Geobacteraceae bacterium]|nr:glycosyltransferase [Geobacteraceae bacterium]